MILEWQKRPFARLLLFWIFGFLLEVCFPLKRVSLFFLLPAVFFLLCSFFSHKRRSNDRLYGDRWLWGGMFCLLVLFLSIQMTAYREQCFLFPDPPLNSLQLWAAAQQERWVQRLQLLQLTDAGRSLLATLAVGCRQAMDAELNQEFIVTGVVHLLSVSGFHVAVVYAAVKFLFSFLPSTAFFRSLSLASTLLLVWLYTCITGLSLPAIRAAVMISVFLVGHFLRRNADGYNSLAVAAFFMLAYQPFYLFDIGFQLSFLAVFFILYLQPRLNHLIVLRNPLLSAPWNALTVTLAAQIGTFPLCCYYFGQFSTVFLFVNLPLALLSGLLLPLVFCWMMLPSGFPLLGILGQVVGSLTECLLWIVDVFSKVPGAMISFRFDFLSMLSCYLILASFLIYLRMGRRKVLFLTLALVLVNLVYQILSSSPAC